MKERPDRETDEEHPALFGSGHPVASLAMKIYLWLTGWGSHGIIHPNNKVFDGRLALMNGGKEQAL